MQKPTIGRIVHYTNLGDKDGKYPPETQAAVITGVYKTSCEPSSPDGQNPDYSSPANTTGEKSNTMFADLLIHYRTGDFRMNKVPFSESPERGCWNWPPRE
jgi:hypothetical protein